MTSRQPSKFGVYVPVRPLGTGRFGPVILAEGPDAVTVVVRTFAMPLSAVQRDRLVSALMTLCGRPLEHPSIARPMACGVEEGQPYLIHDYLPGDSLTDVARRAGSLSPAEVSVRLTYLAGALDFAAAAGVLHGALTADDVMFSHENAAVSGFGLVQALESAGIPGFHAERDDDVAALIALARELLGPDVPPAVGAVLAAPQPRTALAFAAALQGTLPLEAPVATPAIEALFHRESAPAGQVDIPPLREVDIPPLREEEIKFRDEATTLRADVGIPSHDDLAVPKPYDIEPLLGERAMFGATGEEMASAVLPVRPRSSRGLITALVAVALTLGVAGGFFVGRDAPLPTDVVTMPQPAPAATNGQNFTDAAVDEPKPAAPEPVTPAVPSSAASAPNAGRPDSRAAVPERPSPGAIAPPPSVTPGAADSSTTRPAAPRADVANGGSRATPPSPAAPPATRAQTAPPPPPTGPAAMRVDSRPVGAQVFVDGRSVGYTPMVVGDLNPGTHSVRMQLPGYRPWVTAVTLGPGARERVAASLEQ